MTYKYINVRISFRNYRSRTLAGIAGKIDKHARRRRTTSDFRCVMEIGKLLAGNRLKIGYPRDVFVM